MQASRSRWLRTCFESTGTGSESLSFLMHCSCLRILIPSLHCSTVPATSLQTYCMISMFLLSPHQSVHAIRRRFNSPNDTEGVAVQRELLALLERRRTAAKPTSNRKLLDFSRLTSPSHSRELPEDTPASHSKKASTELKASSHDSQ